MRTKLVSLAMLAMLCGCATSYQSSGLTGGHFEVSGYGWLQKVGFSGNGYIDAQTVQQYALYRCAEIAREKKKPYFLIYDSLVAASLGKTATIPAVGSVGNKPTAVAFVLFVDAPQPGALETEKTLRDLSDVVKKNSAT